MKILFTFFGSISTCLAIWFVILTNFYLFLASLACFCVWLFLGEIIDAKEARI